MEQISEIQLKKLERKFLPQTLKLKTFDDIKPFLENLKTREITSVSDLEQWLIDRSELEAYLNEDFAWTYINYTRNTEDEALEKAYSFYIENIRPKVLPYYHQLDLKLVGSKFYKDLDREKFGIPLKLTERDLRVYNEENIPIMTTISSESKKFAAITGAMTVSIDDKELTLQQAFVFLKNLNRDIRKEAFDKINERRLQDAEKLDNLFSELVQLRHKVARNAGFDNFRDYKFVSLGRFDYTVEDALEFHDSIREELMPIINENYRLRKEKLNLEELKPYDQYVDMEGKEPLRPVKDGRELIEKTIECFYRIHPDLGAYMHIMNEKGFLDLESRKGKAPGGYNYPLDESGIPFIFMNASGNFRDLTTMVHEGGHAIHSFLTRDYELNDFKHTPSEVAELASMSMELLSMDHWDVFFDNEDDLRRAKKEQLQSVIDTLPWIAVISKFQHWIYTHPEHSTEERNKAWTKIFDEYNSDIIDWNGYESVKTKYWQKQGHLFNVPFYYIEYGIAQLGAIAIWKNYLENKSRGLKRYLDALKLGYTKSVPEIYETAGIKFNFSRPYVRELAQFINQQMEVLI